MTNLQAEVNIIDLAAIGEATRSAQGYTFIPEEQIKSLDPQLVEFDTKLRNRDNHVAIRCSPAGLKFLASFEQPKPIGLPQPITGFTNGIHVAPISTQEVRDKFPLQNLRVDTHGDPHPLILPHLGPQPNPLVGPGLIDLTHAMPIPLTDDQVRALGITPTDLKDVGVGAALGGVGLNSTNWPGHLDYGHSDSVSGIYAQPASTFPIARGVPIPDIQLKRAKKESPYPFDKLGDPDVVANVYDSFFIPTSPDIPNPAKKFGSTVSNANKKLAPKRFLIRTVEGGARVWRTV